MNETSPLVSERTCSTTSTTGPQTRLWHSSGVEKVITTGFLPTTSAKSSASSSSAGGTRAVSCSPLPARSEEHTPELQSRQYLACRLLLDKRNILPTPDRP